MQDEKKGFCDLPSAHNGSGGWNNTRGKERQQQLALPRGWCFWRARPLGTTHTEEVLFLQSCRTCAHRIRLGDMIYVCRQKVLPQSIAKKNCRALESVHGNVVSLCVKKMFFVGFVCIFIATNPLNRPFSCYVQSAYFPHAGP